MRAENAEEAAAETESAASHARFRGRQDPRPRRWGGSTCCPRRGRDPGQRGPRRRGVLAAQGTRPARRARPPHLPHGTAGTSRAPDHCRRDGARAYNADAPATPARAARGRRGRRPARGRQVAVEAAAQGLAAAEHTVVLGSRLADARVLLDQTTRHALDLREHHLDLREKRISGMAAELAVGLAAGCSCPVCGSAEHPSPARRPARVSRADEDAARERHETADFERQTVQESVTALETQLDGARERAQGLGVSHWQQTHDGAVGARAEPGGRPAPGGSADRGGRARRHRAPARDSSGQLRGPAWEAGPSSARSARPGARCWPRSWANC